MGADRNLHVIDGAIIMKPIALLARNILPGCLGPDLCEIRAAAVRTDSDAIAGRWEGQEAIPERYPIKERYRGEKLFPLAAWGKAERKPRGITNLDREEIPCVADSEVLEPCIDLILPFFQLSYELTLDDRLIDRDIAQHSLPSVDPYIDSAVGPQRHAAGPGPVGHDG